jgi:hypothetical protein
MTLTRRTATVAASAAAALALVGAGAAIAAGGDAPKGDLSGLAERLRAKNTFSDAVAKELGTTSAKLEAAILAAAEARIAAAVADGSLAEADAAVIRAELAEHDRLAMRLADGATVAKELGVTEEKLDAAFNTVRRAQALARIDQGVKDGWITEKAAAEMRNRLESAELPGFGFGGHGPGGRGMGGGFGGFGGHGPGGGGPAGAPAVESSDAPVI